MEIRQIKDLMAVMRRTGTQKLRIKRDGVEVEIERADGVAAARAPMFEESQSAAPQTSDKPALSQGVRAPENSKQMASEAQLDANCKYVTAPIVGVFYATPSPEDPAFVQVGDRVQADTVVCIIEAMKVMNEVKAGVAGVVEEILIDRGHPVEFGSKLIRIST